MASVRAVQQRDPQQRRLRAQPCQHQADVRLKAGRARSVALLPGDQDQLLNHEPLRQVVKLRLPSRINLDRDRADPEVTADRT